MRMEHPSLILQHGILVVAKEGQTFVDKLLQRRARSFGGYCEMEGGGGAHMVGEQSLNHSADLLGDGIGRAVKRIGNDDGRIGRFAVFAVKVPLVPNRLVAVHKDHVTLAHFTIEIFHPQRFAPSAPGLKIAMVG